MQSDTQQIHIENHKNIQLFIKREDLLHPFISGNKYRKLKYNLLESNQLNKTTILTFGGAFSNHIAATAYAGKIKDLKTIGVIRGDELESKIDLNPTLSFAKDNGMQFYFVSREVYREKNSESFQNNLRKRFGDFYLIPEGGTNKLAVKGCEEILTTDDSEYDYICSCVGTGGTISGLINSSSENQKILGFPALKGDFLSEEISKFANNKNWQLIADYHFGGYAKINSELVTFINDFKSRYNIPLDPIYTGKMMFGLFDMILAGKFEPDSKILAIHSGGLQGILGINERLKAKSMPLINV
ncbi:1-aminocyclopropane-1-carboxylate deaminase [Winogradskyella sp. PC-19]|uniref:1-aminocyclopropane-1-carboxylate deaminase/D-cysteine desulfhydrase n=1 Tax=unclassified Winogradskyella TaxID=2615021 RepID=UPI000B3D2BC0|nr:MULTISPECIES: pyridoxal-phosphate dependent enzyme [unclassified Winogradskyella]ARV09293.1 1-aminocyclopropane-1-carboxylate deaminase [Winogradskyella sp. PC-19]RZN74339.1 MAG: 1-aminocyclopropane-1-carboxylate deaminase/D-cysteine desulfhydrase [Winogradskyella sp.]